MREKIREWVGSLFIKMFVVQPYERIVCATHVRGMLYIITDSTIYRYDPESETFSSEGHIR